MDLIYSMPSSQISDDPYFAVCTVSVALASRTNHLLDQAGYYLRPDMRGIDPQHAPSPLCIVYTSIVSRYSVDS